MESRQRISVVFIENRDYSIFILYHTSGHMIFLHSFSDLDKLGGLLPVIQELNNADERIRTISAWVLGKASQNNALVQSQVISLKFTC